MRVRAADGGSPPRTATTILTINVLQNLNAPIFPTQDPCTASITEETPAGQLVDTVTATDSDSKVRANNPFLQVLEITRRCCESLKK